MFISCSYIVQGRQLAATKHTSCGRTVHTIEWQPGNKFSPVQANTTKNKEIQPIASKVKQVQVSGAKLKQIEGNSKRVSGVYVRHTSATKQRHREQIEHKYNKIETTNL
uniref:Uncharacterized protein n=1 Tax=Opuntia streptacantha TaxID=393608 RepID=A0A7C9CM83_OPUST